MSATGPVPPGGWTGGAFGARARCLVAPNPGMMTLDGTNSWVLREPGATRSVVVDPGPVADGHLEPLLAMAEGVAGRVAVVLLTHHHLDHSEVAREFAERAGCAVRAMDPAWCVGADPLVDGEEIEVDGLLLRVLATPGHTADSVSFVVPAERALLAGDMVLGRGTTVVAHPDGALAPYLSSLQTLRALVAEGQVDRLWPGHGPVLDDAAAVLDHYLSHRRARLDQVRAALEALEGTRPDGADRGGADPGGVDPDGADPGGPGEGDLARRVVEVVYADVDESLWAPAELSVRAQLAYLADHD